MPDRRRHRGPHPADRELFGPGRIETLRRATAELSWLFTRGYATPSAVKLVGDRHQLRERQRIAIARCACPDEAVARRRRHELRADAIAGTDVRIDGFNLLTTIEAALAGGVVLVGTDGALRDMAAMHGSWRRVEETAPAIELAGEALAELGARSCGWLLDRPVSNSGRLAAMLRAAAGDRGWPWEVELVDDPDPVLRRSEAVVVTADGAILDGARHWFNLAGAIVSRRTPSAWIVELRDHAGFA